MIAAWCARHLLAPFTAVFLGEASPKNNSMLMGLAIGLCLKLGWKPASVPMLQPGQVVILDNATFHKGGRIRQLPIASERSTPLFAALLTRPEQN